MQILSLTNNRGTLVDGRCCGGGGGAGRFPPCTTPCSTIFWLCLKEYQSNVTAIGSCSFGNVSSQALGTNTFTLVEPTTLQLHFTFRWTVSRTQPQPLAVVGIYCIYYRLLFSRGKKVTSRFASNPRCLSRARGYFPSRFDCPALGTSPMENRTVCD